MIKLSAYLLAYNVLDQKVYLRKSIATPSLAKKAANHPDYKALVCGDISYLEINGFLVYKVGMLDIKEINPSERFGVGDIRVINGAEINRPTAIETTHDLIQRVPALSVELLSEWATDIADWIKTKNEKWTTLSLGKDKVVVTQISSNVVNLCIPTATGLKYIIRWHA